MKKILALLMAVVMLLSVAAMAEGEPITVGISVMKTGTSPDDGIFAEKGITMAVEEINAAGGINGRPIEIIVEDDQGTTEGAVNVTNKLINDGASFIIGPHRSASVSAVADIMEANKMPYITAGTGVNLKQAVMDGIWNTLYFCKPLDSMQASIAATAVIDLFAPGKVGILYTSDAFGTGAMEVATEVFEKNGIEVQCESMNPDDKDVTGQILNLESGACDAVLVWVHNNDMVVVARQTYELGFTTPILTSGATVLPQVIALMEEDWVNGWHAVTNYSRTSESEAVQTFRQKFIDRWEVEPEVMSASYYGAVYIMAEAMKNCEDPTNSEQICAAMANVDIQGVISRLRYHEGSHEYASEAFICRMEGLNPIVEKAVDAG